MTRKIHPVGSLPPEIENPFGWFLGQVARPEELTVLPVDFEQFWIIDYLRSLRDRRTAFRYLRWGDYRDYDDMMVYRPTGQLLGANDVGLRRSDKLDAAFDAYTSLDLGGGVRKPPLMVCRAHPLDLAIFTFVGPPSATHLLRTLNGARLALKHQDLYEEDLTDEVRQVGRLSDSLGIDSVIQLEEPHVLYALLRAPRPARPRLARQLAKRTAHVLSLIRPARTVLHLCHGRLGGKAIVEPDDLSATVLYLNELATECARTGNGLPTTAHVPAAYGRQPVPTHDDFYEPLSALGDTWTGRLIAGVIDPDSATASQTALDLFEHHTGHQAHAVALACGMGDLTPRQAEQAMQISRTVAHS